MTKRKSIKTVITVSVLIFTMLFAFTSCKAKPKAEDARNYVQAILDLVCTGEYDKDAVQFSDIEEGKDLEIRETMIDDTVEEIAKDLEMNDDRKAEVREFTDALFRKVKYSVGDAAETEDGGFDVTVTIEPLDAQGDMINETQDAMLKKFEAEPEKYMSMSEAELTDEVLKMLLEIMNKNLENPTYKEPVEITVHYGLLDEEKNLYGCDEFEIEKLFSQIFAE